jgi:hypothetical protein
VRARAPPLSPPPDGIRAPGSWPRFGRSSPANLNVALMFARGEFILTQFQRVEYLLTYTLTQL